MSNCKWAGRGNPRTLPGRHDTDCATDDCPGCQPCGERHCVVCTRVHADGACPECIAATRDDLAAIRLMCGALPTEVEHRGVNGEALMLLGPTADPEAWGYMEASYLAGRLPEGWFEANHGADCPTLRNEPCLGCADAGERHPLAVLGTWEMVWRDFLEQPSDLRVTIDRAGDYLDRQMHRMAGTEEVPFEDFVRDLRGCRGHLEAVIHDSNQGDPANIGCFECGARIERKLTDAGFQDHWTCRGCRRTYTYAEYNFALRAHLEAARERESA